MRRKISPKPKRSFIEAAKEYQELNKFKRISIRVRLEDLVRVKAKAKRHNIPYQTLLNTLIRQFASGRTKIEI